MEIATIQNMTYRYPNGNSLALDNINTQVFEGDFILLIGESGSGKSTLARAFNHIIPDFYGGTISGNLECKEEVSLVFQDPEKQIVMDSVEKEIAFPLQNKGMKEADINKTVMETLSYMNLWDIKDKKTYNLSGGEKQKVAIASSLAMNGRMMILDEPTSQLDPSAAEEVLNIIRRLNLELGYTIVLVEQRIDRCFNMANRIWYMKNGQLAFDGNKEDFLRSDYAKGFIPHICQLFIDAEMDKSIPETIRDGRKLLRRMYSQAKIEVNPRGTREDRVEINPSSIREDNIGINQKDKPLLIEMKKVYYRYDNNVEALKNVNFHIEKGKIYGVLGEIGSGKTTLLKVIAGLLKVSQGKINTNCKIGYLSQNPNDYLFNETVREELEFTLKNRGVKDEGVVDSVLNELDIYRYRDCNPRDLSGGERQRVALASILVDQPELILLDEPTRGLDNSIKDRLRELLIALRSKGTSIVLVTHDIEFLSMCATDISILFKGEIVKEGKPKDVLSQGTYYSTQMSKLFHGMDENIITYEDGLNKLRLVQEGEV